MMEQGKTALLDDVVWERMLRQTGGAAAACFQCGVCTATCPWGLVRETAPDVRRLLHAAQLGLPEADEAAWLCTACGECEQSCPRRVAVSEVFRSLRHVLWERRQVPAGLPGVLWSLHWNRNPWSQPPSQRIRWADGLDLSAFDPATHEILLFVGCTASYDPRAQKIARAVVRLLRAAGVAFGILGDDEPCCGEAALSLGHQAYFDDLARTTSSVLHARAVKKMVCVSPHAADAFRHHYPELTCEPIPLVGYLAELLDSGRLTATSPVARRVTYHDPCLLGRRDGSYDAPRRLLGAIPELRFVEMEHHAERAICCGGGGGRMWLETPRGERFADLRIREAEAGGAEIVVTSCPFCVVMLEDSARARPDRRLQVLDLAEVLSLALPVSGEGV